MANIPQAQRQYRQQVVGVEPDRVDMTGSQIVSSVADVTTKVMYANAESGLNNLLSKMQSDLTQLTNEYRVKNAHNPNPYDPEYIKARKDIFEKYKSEVSPLVQRDFLTKWKQTEIGLDDENKTWSLRQNQINVNENLKENIKNDLNNAYNAGEGFADGSGDVASILRVFGQSYGNLSEFSTKHLGEAQTNKLLSSYKSDYMKTFLSGVIQKNPIAALDLLERKDIQSDIGDSESYMKLKNSAEARLFNINDIKTKQEVINLMREESGLLAESMERNLSIVELEQAFSKGSISDSAKQMLMKMNGYTKTDMAGEGKTKLTDAQKLTTSMKLTDDIMMALANKDEKSVDDWKELQTRIFDAVNNDSITPKQAQDFINQIVEPSTQSIEENLKTFRTGIPFFKKSTVGFDAIKDYYRREIEINDSWGRETDENALANDRNKARFYSLYYDNLSQVAEENGMTIGKFADLPDTKKNSYIANAIDKTKIQFAEGLGLGRFDNATDANNAVQRKIQFDNKARAAQIIDKAYKQTDLKAPKGIDPMDWQYMTPEERALWN